MKNIIGFIRQNFTFFSFLILQIVSLVMLSSYSKSHQTFFGNWNNAVAVQFGIQSIPANFLLDPNGVVIGKDLRGEDLNRILSEKIK